MLQLVYVSLSRAPLGAAAQKALLCEARSRNAALDVTGLLLTGDMGFFQVLEGPQAAVRAVYALISSDRRHHNVTKLLERPVVERCFPGWSMGADRLDPGVEAGELFSVSAGAVAEALSHGHDGVVQRLAGAFLSTHCRGAA